MILFSDEFQAKPRKKGGLQQLNILQVLSRQHRGQPLLHFPRPLPLLFVEEYLIDDHFLMCLLWRHNKREPRRPLFHRMSIRRRRVRPRKPTTDLVRKSLDPIQQHFAAAAPDQDVPQYVARDVRPPVRRGGGRLRIEVVVGPGRDIGCCCAAHGFGCHIVCFAVVFERGTLRTEGDPWRDEQGGVNRAREGYVGDLWVRVGDVLEEGSDEVPAR